ncbi:MAG: tetratricopeptide repeat protein [Smithellaceae bacterium]|jgi:tetratricopeptide (TPR) repeat protein
MRKIIVSIFLVLTFLCSPAMSEMAVDWFNKAAALYVEGKFTDPKKALEYLNNAIKLQPDYARAYNGRGLAYDDLGEHQRALEDYNESIRLKPDEARAYFSRGIHYAKAGQYQRAIEDYNKVIRLKPDEADAYFNRGVVNYSLSQYQRAIEDYNKAIRLKPKNGKAYNNRGNAYLIQGNKNLGCRDAQKACALGVCKALENAKGQGLCR